MANILRRICMLLLLLPLTAAAKVRVGVEAGVNVNKVVFNKDLFTSDNKMGFFAGLKLCATVPGIGIGFDLAALYSRKTAEIISQSDIWGNIADDKHLNYLEVPVNLRWNIGPEALGIYLATGPQLDWYIGNRTLGNIYSNYSTVFEDQVFTWNVGAGVMLLKHIQLGFTYNIPVTKTGSIRDSFSKTVSVENLKSHTWQVRLNYYF